MDLNGRLRDIDLPCNAFIRIAFDDAAQNRLLPRRKLLGTAFVWRDCQVLARACAIIVSILAIEGQGQESRRKHCFAHDHEFDRSGEYVTAHEVNEIPISTGLKCCGHFIWPVSIGNHNYARIWVTAPKGFDLLASNLEIVAGMYEDKQLLTLFESTCVQLISACH
ncbi:hypothetical protein [Bradyrhizobium sp. LMG 9283]|uniref:hypothetical protein n=1 Tax=Bradyrhizobium sp. LMG 9283 TaxID=592064 RepID=UPI003890DDAD